MKHRLYIIMTALALLMAFGGEANAKRQQVPKMYIFGFAASFNDTIVHFTNIQAVDSAWIDSKTKFLQARDSYSYQLREFLSQKMQMPHRTCTVFYNQKREKLEKSLAKMKKLYSLGKDGLKHNDVRYIADDEFRFQTVALDPEEEESEPKAPAKKEKKKDKKHREKK